MARLARLCGTARKQSVSSSTGSNFYDCRSSSKMRLRYAQAYFSALLELVIENVLGHFYDSKVVVESIPS